MKHYNSQEVLCYITTQDFSSLIFNGGGTCQLAPPVRVRACVCVHGVNVYHLSYMDPSNCYKYKQ